MAIIHISVERIKRQWGRVERVGVESSGVPDGPEYPDRPLRTRGCDGVALPLPTARSQWSGSGDPCLADFEGGGSRRHCGGDCELSAQERWRQVAASASLGVAEPKSRSP